jgi:hypothetical protein
MTTKAKELISQVNDKIANLALMTDAAAQSEQMIAFLQTLSRFYKYSLNNLWLILIQNPDATRVAGYNDWRKKHNRQVMKGEKGIQIIAPAKYRRCNLSPSDPDYHPTDKGYVIKGFRCVTVFDISQTEGEEMPDAPDWKSPARNAELESNLLQFAQDHNIEVEITEDLPEGAQGSSLGGKIKLHPTAGTKTLIHEIAHELLHSKKKDTREAMEIEAESIAFVVGYTFGLDDLASPNYLALHHADAEKITARINTIRETSILIINGVS